MTNGIGGRVSHSLDVAIGHRLRERRRALGMSQADLAEALGLSFQQVQKYERGQNRISFSRLVEAAAALKCELADLAEGLGAAPPAELERVNSLLALEGALPLLEAYAGIGTATLRQALLRHAVALRDAVPARPGGAP